MMAVSSRAVTSPGSQSPLRSLITCPVTSVVSLFGARQREVTSSAENSNWARAAGIFQRSNPPVMGGR